MDMNNSPSNCGVCQEDFNEEERCPRIFLCSHTLCQHCIEKLISRNKRACPFCRQPFNAYNSKDITVNHNTLEFIRYLGSQNITLNPTKRGLSTSRQNIIHEMKKETLAVNCRHISDCQTARTEIEKLSAEVIKLQGTITEENLSIEKDILPKCLSIHSQNKRMLEELYATNQSIDHHMKEICSKSTWLEDIKKKLEVCTAGTFIEIGGLLDEAEETHVPIDLWLRSFKEDILIQKAALTTAQKDVKETKKSLSVIQEALRLREEKRVLYPIQEKLVLNLQFIQEEMLTQQISVERLKEMLAPVKQLVEQGMVFAVQELDGKSKFGRLSFTADQQLALHHFKDEPIPPTAHYVQYNEILKLEDVAPKMTFLELSNASGSSLGRIYIRLTPHLRRGLQFAMLCTAENGPCYANTKILGVTNRASNTERLHFGDYEKNDGSGGLAIIKGVENDVGGEHLQSWSAGRVTGRWMSESKGAQFYIYTGNKPEKTINGSFGVVEKGLRVLSETLLQYPCVEDIVISDCGIVLSF